MSDQVTIQLIATIGVVLVGVFGFLGTVVTVLGARLVGRVKAIQSQVQNSHDSNLRDDLDGKHDENKGLLLKIQRDIAWLMRVHAEEKQRLTDHIDTTTEGKHHDRPQAHDPRGIPGLSRREFRRAHVPADHLRRRAGGDG